MEVTTEQIVDVPMTREVVMPLFRLVPRSHARIRGVLGAQPREQRGAACGPQGRGTPGADVDRGRNQEGDADEHLQMEIVDGLERTVSVRNRVRCL